MGSFNNNVVTKQGQLLIGKMLKGDAVTFTRIVMGDGTLEPGVDLEDIEDVISPKATVTPVTGETIGAGEASIGGLYTNNEETQGFWWRELGLYAEDPELGEVLYSYGNSGEFCEYIPPSGGPTAVEKVVNVITSVKQGARIELRIPSDAYVTHAQFQQYLELVQTAVSAAQQALTTSEQALVYARGAYGIAQAMKATVEEMAGRVQTIWDALFTEITTNPFMVSFQDLDGIDLVSGTWNRDAARLEC